MGTPNNAPCWCGSGKKFKRCHHPTEAPKTTAKKTKATDFNHPPTFQEFAKMMGIPANAIPTDFESEGVLEIKDQKKNGTRAKPSAHLIDKSNLLTPENRKAIIDIAAKNVDENWCGRAEMCQQFAMVAKYLLKFEGVNSKIITGDAEYFDSELKYNWDHFWLTTDDGELIDCNIDSLPENPFAPKKLRPFNYWGPVTDVPKDRTYTAKNEFTDQDEQDLEKGDNETVIWKQQALAEYKKMNASTSSD